MRFVISLLVLLVIPSSAFAWWNDKWSNRMPITVTYPQSGSAWFSDDPNVILVKLHAGIFPDFFSLKENLADLRFISSDDKTALKFHVDSFDLTNQLLFVWVQLPPSKVDTHQTFWMYYGNSDAALATDSAATFDVNQTAIFHFSNTDASLSDATANNNQAVLSGAEIVKASLIGAGLKFNKDSQLVVKDSPSNAFNSTVGFSFSTWIKPISIESKPVSILSRTDSHGSSMDIFADAASITVQVVAMGKSYKLIAPKALETAKWQHLAVTVDANKIHLFLNAEELKVEASGAFELTGAVNIGGKSTLASGFNGEMDEIHFTKKALAPASINVMVNNQGMVDEIVSVKAPEEAGKSETSNGMFEVIIKSTDTLGWMLMGLMGVMAFISWIVMFGKALYLRQVKKDNTAFMKGYAKLVERDPAELDKIDDEEDEAVNETPITQAIFGKHDHFQSSTLYHLYHRGISEVRARAKTIQETGLTTRANNAIRATLDAQLIRESQRLNSQMVLLTIAISGGPFIGLFGTVMGVMITFAAIAKTGDVNIAAIAPGVAAALLTTLGGLSVAIPALFGYNYLSSRIKESIADMRVFGDEFTTRLAEYYGRS